MQYRISLYIAAFLFLVASCKKEDVPAGLTITNGSFENGSFSTEGWTTQNTSSSTDVPADGGTYSLKIDPGTFPDEGYADYTIEDLSGTKNLRLTCYCKAFGAWPGSVTMRKLEEDGTSVILGTEASDVNAWTMQTIEVSVNFVQGDKLIIHLSAGSTEIPVDTQYALFDKVELSEI